MKIGISFANTGPFATAEGARSLAEAADAVGVESLWTVEHVVFPDGYESEYPYDPSGRMPMRADTPLVDPLIWLTWVAACTQRVRLATGILILPERNPVLLAKEVATLDWLSGGRVELGIGIGWLKEEFAALGIPWERRGARTDEYVAIMRTLWREDRAEFAGEFHRFAPISVNPKPPHGSVPIVIGGHTRAAAERAGRIGDGFWPAKGDLVELIDIVRQTAADCGRDPLAIEISSSVADPRGTDPKETLEESRSLGVGRIIVPARLFWDDPQGALEDLFDHLGLANDSTRPQA